MRWVLALGRLVRETTPEKESPLSWWETICSMI
jgi:hypothetical protein